jgi:apolipoprotein N-acyltransferase
MLLPLAKLFYSPATGIFLIGNLLFAFTYYAFGFRGILGCWDGVLAGIWFCLTVAFSALHVTLFMLLRLIVSKRRNKAWWVFPIAFTAFEYLRHHVSAAYDGNGLTLLTLGQAFAQTSALRQIADLGGIWLISTAIAAAAAIIADLSDSQLSIRRRASELTVLMGGTALVLGYGWVRVAQYAPQMRGTAIIVTTPIDSAIISRLEGTLTSGRSINGSCLNRDSFDQELETCCHWKYVVSAEGSLIWQEQEVSTSPHANVHLLLTKSILKVTRHDHTVAVIGVTIPTQTGSTRISQYLLSNGRVRAVADKQYLVPSVEVRVPGLAFLEKHGHIPNLAALRGAVPARARPIDYPAWSMLEPCIVPATCYDLFFPEHFAGHSWEDDTAICCSSADSFDGSGVFQRISEVHARMRAIEFRCPVIRASLDGISGVMNGNGDWVAIADESICPIAIPFDSRESLYSEWGDWWPKLCVTVAVCLLLEALYVRLHRISWKLT